MNCDHCGERLREGALFCGKCGSPVRTRAQVGAKPEPASRGKAVSPAPGPKSDISKSLIIGVAIAAAIIAVLIFLLATGKLEEPMKALGDTQVPPAVITCLAFVFLALIAYSAFKENATTGLFKTFGVYGRVKAYLFANCAFSGTIFTIGALIMPLLESTIEKERILLSFVIGVAAVALSVVLYLHSKSKCPEMLKHRLLGSMFLSGLGITIKLTFFFLLFLFGTYWALEGPREMVDEDGRSVFVYHDDVYDHTGWRVGYVDPYDDSRYIRTD